MQPKKWIWQHAHYPQFPYDPGAIVDSIGRISYHIGRMNEIISFLDRDAVVKVEVEAMTDEIVSSNEIEGAYLSRESVISSVKKAIDPTFDLSSDRSTHDTDSLVKILQDAISNPELLTKERIHSWHAALFPTGQSGLTRIKTGTYRTDEMEVISNPYGRKKVHYIAPPSSLIDQQMNSLLDYVNHSDENPYIKSAKAHLWFVVIHPYDDGNGRLARVITDYILAKDAGLSYKYHSISTAINIHKKEYYEILEKSNNLIHNRTYDFTEWFTWHLEIHAKAIENSICQTETIIKKAKLWDKINTTSLNERQKKVLNKLANIGEDNFVGGLSTKKYQAIAKTSRATAIRDINDLISKGFLKQVEGTAGRSIRYRFALL